MYDPILVFVFVGLKYSRFTISLICKEKSLKAKHHTLRLVTPWVLREGGEMGGSEGGEGREETSVPVRLGC